MHTWVRRGLQTALVTGGLLMLGTGIASADENVNPDQPPSPVDAGVSVPVNTDHNAIGTPFGQYDAPSVHRDISTGDVTGAAARKVGAQALPTNRSLPTGSLPTGSLPTGSVGAVAGQANPLVRQAQPALQNAGGHDLFRGNKVVVNAVVPVQICGNAVAVGGDAHESAACSQVAGHRQPITTSGRGQVLGGNVVAVNPAVPVQVTGNAVGAIGNAFAHSVAGQSATTGGDIRTTGRDGVVSGTIAAVQWGTPVQVADNGVAGIGRAYADSASESDATSPGSLRTSGNNGTGSGTVGGVPVAVPFQVDGNGIAGAGNAGSQSMTTSNATAGSTNAHNIGLWGHPTWVMTEGDPATLSGNVAQPQVSGPVSVDDNAGSAIGNTTASSTNNSTDTAGGLTSTTGNGSVGSGNVADAPVALPSNGAGNGVAAIGNAAADHTNNVSSTAGGDTLTNGDHSVLSANTANVPPVGAPGVCGESVGAAGGTNGSCDNNTTATTGGYDGTTGNSAVVSGNEGQVPVALPVGGSGTAGGVLTNSSASSGGSSSYTSGGEGNTNDDNGTLTSNMVSTPTALPAQVMGDAANVGGISDVTTDDDTTTTAGGPANATGHNATGAGNIVFVPTSAPSQVFGSSDTVVGNGSTVTSASSLSKAGGWAHSDGSGGSVSGNIAQVSAQPVDQVFGEAGSAVGLSGANTGNELDSTAGGDTTTNGDYGALAGNAVAVPASVTDQVFGDAVAAGSQAYGNGTSDSQLNNGGQVVSSGHHGSGSGNVLTVPADVDPDVFGDAVSAVGNAEGVADNNRVINNGGDSFTDGGGPLDAYNFNWPVGADLDVIDAPVPVLGRSTTMVEDNSIVNNGYDTVEDSTMALPGGFGGQMGYGASTPDFPQLPDEAVLADVPQLPSFDGVAPSPTGPQTQAAQAAPAAPGLPGLPQVPSVPLAQGALGKAGHLPVGQVESKPVADVQGVKSLTNTGGEMAGVRGVTGITGVLPVAHGLFPNV
ncbi:MAG TPA: hypothetical protein VHF06_26065 [Pseudonocardiaceae bacterium]|jgi:hypothetical protein|nr:hypothetical protein [Pseudonocardiaceae bacterium]